MNRVFLRLATRDLEEYPDSAAKLHPRDFLPGFQEFSALPYKPHVFRVQLEADRYGPALTVWDVETNPYFPHSRIRRPTLAKAMQVVKALHRGVPEEDLSPTFEGFCGLLELCLNDINGEISGNA